MTTTDRLGLAFTAAAAVALLVLDAVSRQTEERRTNESDHRFLSEDVANLEEKVFRLEQAQRGEERCGCLGCRMIRGEVVGHAPGNA